jgi:predicted nucleic acid-binding protein
MTIIDIKGAEQEIIKVANWYNLSFYDASYVHIAKKIGAILVTEDDKLSKKINKYIQAIKAEELPN